MTELASSLKALRKQNRMTQDDLAAKLNVTRQTVSNYENGKSEPDIEMLVRIAEVFHTDVNSLVNMEAAHQEAEIPKHWGKAVGLVVVTIVVFTILHYMTEWANAYSARHYNLSFLFAIVGFLNAELLVGLFRDDPEVIAIGTVALSAQMIALFFQPLSVCANMMFQSIGKNGVATFLAMLRSGLFLIPILLVLSATMGLTGIEIAQTVSDVLTCLVSIPFVVKFLKTLKQLELEENKSVEA